MKKLVIAVVAIAALALAFGANAEEKYVAGGFEASGHINAGLGFDYIGTNSGALAGGSSGLLRDQWSNAKNYDKAKDFGFLLDEVELDLTKSFGENIKFRTDLGFGDQAIGSIWGGVYVKQAYVTANIPAGNGIEWLFGRFDAPIGYEAVDRNDNNTITHSAIYNFNIRPRYLTGMKFYYAFNDSVDWHVWFANNMSDGRINWNGDNKVMPAIGTRLGYTWGEEAKESTVGLSAAISPEVNAGSKLGRMSFLVDVDFNIWATDAFVIGGEALYRQNDAAKGTTSTKIFGGILDLNYAFSDVWDGTLKYSILRPNNGGGTSDALLSTMAPVANALVVAKGYIQEISVSPAYQITDGAKFRAEYKLDWTKYSGFSKNLTHTVLGMFEYAF
ncbi:MAG: hypothetical protein COV46_07800 [Deltaproteobacteria bacterium CG11_big_fil_rev_8_21_14_0_20_49_13]|nr:MAG: hypothetical protein COV46_07800 [Deltaproteobacteria bacterium CG11_big_fil_rev_8_21_14_0_20_49_13]